MEKALPTLNGIACNPFEYSFRNRNKCELTYSGLGKCWLFVAAQQNGFDAIKIKAFRAVFHSLNGFRISSGGDSSN